MSISQQLHVYLNRFGAKINVKHVELQQKYITNNANTKPEVKKKKEMELSKKIKHFIRVHVSPSKSALEHLTKDGFEEECLDEQLSAAKCHGSITSCAAGNYPISFH